MNPKNKAVAISRTRWTTLLLLVVVTLLGLGFRAYRGPLQNVVNHYGPASVCYMVFFILAIFFLLPRSATILPIAIGVLVWTCFVEFSQLWHPPWLESIRGTVAGRLLFGNSFSWWDFPAYLVGCLLGWSLCRSLVKSQHATIHEPVNS